MKWIFALALSTMTLCSALAQDKTEENEKPERKLVSGRPQFRLYGIYQMHFGDNAFADAYRSQGGLGFSVSPLRVQDFRLAVGAEANSYHVKKKEMIGLPVGDSAYRSLFAEISYTIGSEDGFSIKPSVGGGGSIYYLRTGSSRFGNQQAGDLRAGLTADWAVSKHLSLFLSARYVYSNINVDTSNEYHDYYSKANSVQISAGLMLR